MLCAQEEYGQKISSCAAVRLARAFHAASATAAQYLAIGCSVDWASSSGRRTPLRRLEHEEQAGLDAAQNRRRRRASRDELQISPQTAAVLTRIMKAESASTVVEPERLISGATK